MMNFSGASLQYWLLMGGLGGLLGGLMATRYRDYVVFLVAGMAFWLLIEAVRTAVQWAFSASPVVGYAVGGVVGLILLAFSLIWSERSALPAPSETEVTGPYAEHNPSGVETLSS